MNRTCANCAAEHSMRSAEPRESAIGELQRYSADDDSNLHDSQQAQTLPMLAPQQVIFVKTLDAWERLGYDSRDARGSSFQDIPEKSGSQTPAPFERRSARQVRFAPVGSSEKLDRDDHCILSTIFAKAHPLIERGGLSNTSTEKGAGFSGRYTEKAASPARRESRRRAAPMHQRL